MPPDRAEAVQGLEAFLSAAARAGLPACDAFAKGIRIWRGELLAYFDEPTTQGYAEGVINKPTTNGDAEGVINKVKGHQAPRLRHSHLRRLPATVSS